MITIEYRIFHRHTAENLTIYKRLIKDFNLQQEGTRTDLYSPFTAATGCGLKFREGKLEIKSLISSELIDGLTVSSWEKLPLNGNLHRDQWLVVEKKRFLNFFNLKAQQIVSAEESQSQLEISEVKYNEQKYLSVCVEASGEKQKLALNNMLFTLQQSTDYQSLQKTGYRASYPEFLISD